ncbi:MAG: hypothetical protein P8X81_01120 [Woeseiaceae bacterium]|jgi:hypothetical protein
MNPPVLALILVVLLLIWLLVRRRQGTADKTSDNPAPRVSQKNTAFHAVSIKITSNACKAARDLEGRRFLSSAAPRLPLPECDVLECNCRFAHHEDRRTGKDRRSPFRPGGFGAASGRYEQEQREGKDRRASEEEESF